MDKRLKLLEIIKLKLQGRVAIGRYPNDHSSKNLPVYLFECEKHGLVENYPRGFQHRLECPECEKEKRINVQNIT